MPLPEAQNRIKLHRFIMQLVDAWNRDRQEDPEDMPTAVAVTKTIWAAEETVPSDLSDNANALRIADILEVQAKEFFGGHQWSEMEDYINRLTPDERALMNLEEFTGIFYDVLRDFGTPDGGSNEESNH